ncbi:malic enzyme-like NAD(P)-binding protein [Streptomyces sp. NPDC048484]|uniref:malic enzyme-like NAD(P)-binding protein n=1 Tax=Streptomyces sp. NPDC048484 TaxID=3155146 RepID=UPI00341A2F56
MILVGTSTVYGAFTRDVVTAMAAQVDRPVILPLSNPSERIEAMPADLLAWTDGRALCATGIPVDPVELNGVRHVIGQANNALVYPGLGLGVVVSRAERVTAHMLRAAAEAVAGRARPGDGEGPLLPPVDDLRALSATIAVAVVHAAAEDGVAVAHDDPVQAVQDAMREPVWSRDRRRRPAGGAPMSTHPAKPKPNRPPGSPTPPPA